MDEPIVLAVSLLGPFALGLLLRLKGAVLAALLLAGYAVALAAGDGSSAELVGAAVLGAGGGFALGWAGSLTRRVLRRRR
jgi:membrane associated rhomboid family serine protease